MSTEAVVKALSKFAMWKIEKAIEDCARAMRAERLAWKASLAPRYTPSMTNRGDWGYTFMVFDRRLPDDAIIELAYQAGMPLEETPLASYSPTGRMCYMGAYIVRKGSRALIKNRWVFDI